jgi:hypothetical protein
MASDSIYKCFIQAEVNTTSSILSTNCLTCIAAIVTLTSFKLSLVYFGEWYGDLSMSVMKGSERSITVYAVIASSTKIVTSPLTGGHQNMTCVHTTRLSGVVNIMYLPSLHYQQGMLLCLLAAQSYTTGMSAR